MQLLKAIRNIARRFHLRQRVKAHTNIDSKAYTDTGIWDLKLKEVLVNRIKIPYDLSTFGQIGYSPDININFHRDQD
jgi:hypothetical protein